MTHAQHANRHAGIDVARALGMILMYYGHFVEQIMYLHNPAAASQYKCIYSFHMIFFFIISGWAGGRSDPRGSFARFFKYRLVSRIVPYLTFSVILALMAQGVPGWYPLADVRTVQGFFKATMSTVLGFPLFNIPLWFLGCLVSVECCHFWLMRLGSMRKVCMVAAAMLVAGFVLNARVFVFEHGLIFWLLNEVPVVYAFYLLGVLLAKSGLLDRKFHPRTLGITGALCALLVLATYDLNSGPFRILQAVVILLSSHGQPFWFGFTALAGAIMLLSLGKLWADNRLLGFIGQNSLILLGMNGAFYHFVNAPLAAWFAATFPASGFSVLIVASLVTAASLVLCLPIIVLLNRFVPQLMGKPRVDGPLLPALWREAA